MEVGQRWVRCYSYLFHFRYNLRCGWRLRRPFPQCVSQALLGELILRIKMQRAAELGQGFDLLALKHRCVSALQVIEHNLLTSQFPRGHVIKVSRNQPRRRLEFIKSLIQLLAALQFQALGESLAGLFQFSFRRIARWGSGGILRTRQGWQIRRMRAAEGCGSQSPDDQDHLPPTHVPIVTGKPRTPMSFWQGGVPSCIRLRARRTEVGKLNLLAYKS